MKETKSTTWTIAKIAGRWTMHPSSVSRVMGRFGVSGAKFGTSRQAARRFSDADVRRVEKLAGLSFKSLANEEETI
ncbi:MAG: hypothetical protein P4L99_25510 [Chthoniobacter sp.]|nr:hypothetical protein [Chthoniobacter sp.]